MTTEDLDMTILMVCNHVRNFFNDGNHRRHKGQVAPPQFDFKWVFGDGADFMGTKRISRGRSGIGGVSPTFPTKPTLRR